MRQSSLKDAAAALFTALAGRLNVSEADTAPGLAQRSLQRRLLSIYADELDGLDAEKAAAWLLDRLAAIEARQLILQSEQWHGFHREEEIACPEPPAAQEITPQKLPPELPPEPLPSPPAQGAAEEPHVLPASVTVRCDEAMAHRGFYPVEHAPDGAPFRWIGPEPKAVIYLPRLHGAKEVRIFLHGAFVPEVLDDIKISLDGGEPAIAILQQDEETPMLVARPVPGPHSETASMQLDIDAVRTDSPSRSGADDPRELAIAVLRVTVKNA